jgi:sugar lactone lactonase YvrE
MGEANILLEGLGFPEGPRWHDGELWFSDFIAKTVSSVTLDAVVRPRAVLDDRPSGIGFLPGGEVVVVSMGKKHVVRIDRGSVTIYADLSDLPGNFLNDMLVDADGRLYVGLRSAALRPHEAPLPASAACDGIAIVEPDGSVRIGASDMISPNGMVLSPAGDELIVAETYAQRVLAFARRPDGSLGKRRVFAEVPGRYPDGLCLDDSGAVWFGSPYTDEFVRVGEGGTIIDRIEMPGGVACALGGPQLRLLFLLAVSPELLSPVDGKASPASDVTRPGLSGRILTMAVNDGAAGWQ